MLRSSTWSHGGWSKSAAVCCLLFWEATVWLAAADSALQLQQADQLSQHRADQQPDQIHIAYASDDQSISISWSTAAATLASCVQYQSHLSGAAAAPALACGRSKRLEAGGPEGYVQVWETSDAPGHLLRGYSPLADAYTGGAAARCSTLWSFGA